MKHALLLFTFLENLKKTGIDYPVIIAGDFNRDIREVKSLEEYLDDYYVHDYALRPLRAAVEKKEDICIDFIVVSKTSSDWEIKKHFVTAHDLEVSPEIMIELEKAAAEKAAKKAAKKKKKSKSTSTPQRPRGVSKDVAHATGDRKMSPSPSPSPAKLQQAITNHSPLSTPLRFSKQ